ncbi:hypothetical protein DSM106972_048750 [Dulcicalothrix desertica PCC 7102]|uniref:N-acetyltransferase domain-containing protein n=1 Tax=Dulcicalothrix desertica PCC 7102 TaxID=232991 RepID=A0A3S1D5P4_9CYAN|nr:hypothetical protein DSM106972_048750 [Dulcicalothrix desertica PCC 7102]TWH43631.1 hypothetical protein CAL7102_07370 [Dulcicalothrix desertica PCC 7102]
MVQLEVELKRGIDDTSVQAYLVDLKLKHAEDFENLWKNILIEFEQEDKFWDWKFKLRYAANNSNIEAYAIECENETQGLMQIETQLHGSQIERGQRLVYIDGLFSAPLNRIEIQNPPRFRNVGTILLEFARIRSVYFGYKGRVGLHSLPEAVGFYNKQNMYNLGEDEDYENLVYFEHGILRNAL